MKKKTKPSNLCANMAKSDRTEENEQVWVTKRLSVIHSQCVRSAHGCLALGHTSLLKRMTLGAHSSSSWVVTYICQKYLQYYDKTAYDENAIFTCYDILIDQFDILNWYFDDIMITTQSRTTENLPVFSSSGSKPLFLLQKKDVVLFSIKCYRWELTS